MTAPTPLDIARKLVAYYEAEFKSSTPLPDDDDWIIAIALIKACEAITEHLAAEDAVAIFMIEVDPEKIGEPEWQRRHRVLHDRRRAARAALSCSAPPEDKQGG